MFCIFVDCLDIFEIGGYDESVELKCFFFVFLFCGVVVYFIFFSDFSNDFVVGVDVVWGR